MFNKKSLLFAAILMPVMVYAGGQADFQSGLDFTGDPTGGQPAAAGKPAGNNAANLSNLVNLFMATKDLGVATGTDKNPNLNSASQSANDLNILKTYMGDNNIAGGPSAITSLNQAGGRGDQKLKFCFDYVNPAKTPTPDPVKLAECTGVNNLSKQFCADYLNPALVPAPDKKIIAECQMKEAAKLAFKNTGFGKNDAIFGPNSQIGQAKKLITDTPQASLVAVVTGAVVSGANGQMCTTVNKVTPPQMTQAICARAAVPDSQACGMVMTPKVILEKYCNAHGGPNNITSGLSSSGSGGWGFAHIEPFYVAGYNGPMKIEYGCGTPSLIDGSVTTIIAKLYTPAGVYPNNNGPLPPLTLEFTPGVSKPWVTGSMGYNIWQCGWSGNCIDNYNAAMFYDGAADTLNVRYLGMSTEYGPETGGDNLVSCKPGTNFLAPSAPYTIPVPQAWSSGNPRVVISWKYPTYYAVKSRCETPGISSMISVPGTVVKAVGTYVPSNNMRNANASAPKVLCPTGYLNYVVSQTNPTCYKIIPGVCPTTAGNSYFSLTPPNPTNLPAGSTANTAPTPSATYCTLQSAINDLHLYTPATHYLGGAGIRNRLIENVVDTCAPLQAQAANGPTGPSGSYTPVTKMTDTCPTTAAQTWNLTPATASFPAECRYQPAVVNANKTTVYSCPNGGVYSTISGLCERQDPGYPAVSSGLYTCPVGDIITGAACPNGGTLQGQSCLYQPYDAAISSSTCATGFQLIVPSGATTGLCYNDPILAQTIFAVDNVNVFDPTNTYACNGADILNGTMCEAAAQTVTCDHQPPSVGSIAQNHYNCPATLAPMKTGIYPITYVLANDLVQAQTCVAQPVTKPASIQRRVCNAPYVYNGATDKCEYQIGDYAATVLNNCSANPGYTYDPATARCFLTPATYPAF